jgi:arylsulfatase A-like enzyme
MRVLLLVALVAAWPGVAAAAVAPTIVHVVADDLGFNDLGFKNQNRTHTPGINKLVAEGIELTHYHTYKVCGPSRASIMTGRYPWGVGYYDMTGAEAVPLDYTLLPEVMQKAGWSTHAIGKWDLGAWTKRYTPTFRGLSSFFGYYNAALKDYWFHGGTCSKACNPFSTDLSNSSGISDPAGVRHASDAANGTYDQQLFTTEAVRLVRQHGMARGGLYLYLAYLLHSISLHTHPYKNSSIWTVIYHTIRVCSTHD